MQMATVHNEVELCKILIKGSEFHVAANAGFAMFLVRDVIRDLGIRVI